jgi:hypothetical protein
MSTTYTAININASQKKATNERIGHVHVVDGLDHARRQPLLLERRQNHHLAAARLRDSRNQTKPQT